jgi:ADP-ribosylglycohydrolase
MRLRMLCLQAESRRGDMNGMVLGQFAGDLWGRTVEDYTGSEPRRRDCTLRKEL